MTDRPRRTPTEIDDTEDRMGSVHPLDFDESQDERSGRVGDPLPEDEVEDLFPTERAERAGMSAGETPDGEPGMDDLAPEVLIPEDGARSPSERGHGEPADQLLSEVDEADAGLSSGLDEAEQARIDPLDGQPWDGAEEPAESDALEEDDTLLSDEELEGDAPLDSARYRKPDA
ncbi:hypothetical protein [Stutzerimonas tarimensis]|uniref:Phosphotransferase system, HPr-related protein n=1 Tax=Stutzerimonas tarimensis TaxID=1507735 RepID=A0ABV7T1E5_9GAMM